MVLEKLESRRMLSVSAQVTNKILVVSGDAEPNVISVTDYGGGNVRALAGSTPLNGNDGYFTGVTGVVVAAGQGDDSVSYTNDVIGLPGSGPGSYVPALVSLGAGNDRASVDLYGQAIDEEAGTAVDAPITVSVDAGTGNDTIYANAFNKATVVVAAGDGSDGGEALAQAGGTVYINAGAGDDKGDQIVTSGFALTANNGTVGYNGGTGNDVVTLTASQAFFGTSSVTADGGAGDDYIIVSSVGYGGVVSVSGGAGNDTVEVAQVAGELDLRDFAVSAGQVTVTGGNGDDTFIVSEIYGQVVISGGNGADTVYLDGDIGVGGHLSIDGGNGYDRLFTVLSQDDRSALTLTHLEKVTVPA
jgi:hypothetical protein